jgi:hypothetical protein
MANSASGIITVANTVAGSIGIYNRRDNSSLDSKYYVSGTITNAGSITISNSGASNGYGVYNVSLFTNSATGTFTIDPSPDPMMQRLSSTVAVYQLRHIHQRPWSTSSG